MAMFQFKKKKDAKYILIKGDGDAGNFAEWELIDQDALEERAKQNMIIEGSRLFRIAEEVEVRFEKATIIG